MLSRLEANEERAVSSLDENDSLLKEIPPYQKKVEGPENEFRKNSENLPYHDEDMPTDTDSPHKNGN